MNALLKLSRQDGERAQGWRDAMVALPAQEDAEEFLRCGLLAAWRLGFSAYRRAALAGLGAMRSANVEAILSMPAGTLDGIRLGTFAAAMEAEPWSSSEALARNEGGRAIVRSRIGGFAGLGGEFRSPPLVFRGAEGFFAIDGEYVFAVTLDRYGSTLARSDATPGKLSKAPGAPWRVETRGAAIASISREGLSFEPGASMPPGISSIASDDTSLLITSPYSYRVFIVGIGRA
jgi:hypothetical protein